MFFLLILHVFCLISSISSQRNAFFRKDYTYLESTESFYKIHTIHRTWLDAKKRCEMEGAQLFYPVDQSEADAVISFWNQTQPFYWVYIGISDLIAKGAFETIDGRSVNDVFNKWSPGEPNDAGGIEDCVILRKEGNINDDSCNKKYPFICKKTLASLDWNVLCDMPDRKYQYDRELGKCYKFHLNPMNWTDAVAMCHAEESYLAVINSREEALHLVKLTKNAPKDSVQGDYLRGAVHLGFHNRNGEGWQTIKGTSLEDSGYARWSYNQPDSAGSDGETCGTMFYDGDLNDMNCGIKCFFICEHDINSLSTAFEDRIGE